MNIPSKPGFYWAKWMIADEEAGNNTPFKTWETVEVYLRDFDDRPDELRVWLLGHEFSQPLDCFHWGEQLIEPVDKTQEAKERTEKQRLADAVERYKAMTPDEREEYLQKTKRERGKKR